jgi:putative acetyltransferase
MLAKHKEFGSKMLFRNNAIYAKCSKLYKSGFNYIDAPMGGTGHTSCPVWMLKNLQE